MRPDVVIRDRILHGWRADAACRGRTHLFFDPTPEARAEAVAICDGCPVRRECFGSVNVHDIDNPARHMVTAGVTPEQRGYRRGAPVPTWQLEEIL